MLKKEASNHYSGTREVITHSNGAHTRQVFRDLPSVLG